MNSTASHITHAAPQSVPPRPIAPRPRDSSSSDRPSWRETVAETEPIIDTPAFYGPPIHFVLGPWLLLVLLLMGPFALLVTIVLATVVAAGLLAVCAAVIASPYLLIRHVNAHGMVHVKPRAPRHMFRSIDRRLRVLSARAS